MNLKDMSKEELIVLIKKIKKQCEWAIKEEDWRSYTSEPLILTMIDGKLSEWEKTLLESERKI